MMSPIIICNGVIRSGSTWSYNVCRLLGQILAGRRSQPFGTMYLNPESLERFFQADVNSRDGPIVIKGHNTGPVALEWIRTGRARAVCTLRDPRDCVASSLKYWGVGFDAALAKVVASYNFLPSYIDFGRTLFVRYEDMMNDRLWQIKRIAAHVQIDISPHEVEMIDAQTDIPSNRKICQELTTRTDDLTDVVVGEHRRDRVTLLHDNHIDSAEVGRWKRDLTPEQGQYLTKLFQRNLQVLGYEIDPSLASSSPDPATPKTGLANPIPPPPS